MPLQEGTGLQNMLRCLVFKTTEAGWGWRQLHFLEHMGIEPAVACSQSHDDHLLSSFKEMNCIRPCGLLSQQCLHKGLLLYEADTVFGLSFSGSKFGELISSLIAWDSAMRWYPLQDYSSALQSHINRGLL